MGRRFSNSPYTFQWQAISRALRERLIGGRVENGVTLHPMLPVTTVYVGLITMFAGAICLLKPLSFLAIHTRWQALIVVFAGLVIVLIGTSLPAAEVRITSPRSELDRFVPVYQFDDFHSVYIAASKETVDCSIREVTAVEIRLFITLP